MKKLAGELVLVVAFVASLFICSCVFLGVFALALFFIPSPSPSLPEEEASPAWSPDGQRIAFECYLDGPTKGVFESNQRQFGLAAADICVVNVNGSHRTRLTANDVADIEPTWSPDGTRIAYTSSDGIYVIDSDGSNQRRLVHVPPKAGSYYVPEGVTWSPNGKYLAFSACLDQDRDIYIAEVDNGVLTNLTAGNLARDMNPLWLPDSRRIVFLSSHFPADDSCDPSLHLSTSWLESTNIEGTNETEIYGEAFYISVSVSPTGQLAFIANRHAKNDIEEAMTTENTLLYTLRPGEAEPTSWGKAQGTCTWSSDGGYLACRDYILDVRTGNKRKFPSTFTSSWSITWSPDSQKIATVRTQRIGNIFAKRVVILDLNRNVTRPLIPREESPEP